MNKLEVQTVALSDLTFDPQNVRKHDERNLEAIKRSLDTFGQRKPIVCARGADGALVVLAGNGTLQAATALGWSEIGVVEVPADWDADKARAFAIADNRTAELAEWDQVALSSALVELDDLGWDLADLGFERAEPEVEPDLEELDELVEVAAEAVSVVGDVWILGDHRVMCGDSTDPASLAILMNGQRAQLLHADPPYGMGKQKDGVLNDNLYREKLDRFQLDWWNACRPHLTDNASAYIWGNAPDLWRLWYAGGLADSEVLEFGNEIVWDKKAIPGMASDLLTQFPEASERCLFFQIGEQFKGNINVDDFPETWEPLRAYFADEAEAAGLTAAQLRELTKVQMWGHWFTRSQFTLMPEKHYARLQSEYPNNFRKSWRELKAEWDKVNRGPQSKIAELRSYFDNGHDVMRDVWEFGRVTGDERHGHATPKPIAMMQRAIKSACPEGGIVLEPFGGSGSTLIGADSIRRVCYTIELDPRYVDVICRRYQKTTGVLPVHAKTGEPHDFLAESHG